MRYEEILKKMKDYDENLSKEKIAKAYQEKEKRRLEVSFKIIYLYYFPADEFNLPQTGRRCTRSKGWASTLMKTFVLFFNVLFYLHSPSSCCLWTQACLQIMYIAISYRTCKLLERRSRCGLQQSSKNPSEISLESTDASSLDRVRGACCGQVNGNWNYAQHWQLFRCDFESELLFWYLGKCLELG